MLGAGVEGAPIFIAVPKEQHLGARAHDDEGVLLKKSAVVVIALETLLGSWPAPRPFVQWVGDGGGPDQPKGGDQNQT